MSYVFVSYSREDMPFVERLAADLREAGIELWYDVAKLMPGENWLATIEQALSKAAAVLFVSTPSGNASRFALGETEAAIRWGIPVVPLVVEEPPTALVLRSRQWIDFRPDYRTALAHLIASLPRIVVQGHPLPPTQPKSKGYVFISYAEEDSEFVSSLRDFLKIREYGYWDYQESDRDYHKQFSLELEEIISRAAATLSILSPDWKRSKWASKEYLFSEEVNVPVFLLRFRDMGPTLVIAGVPYIDFVADVNQGFAKLDRELKRKGLA